VLYTRRGHGAFIAATAPDACRTARRESVRQELRRVIGKVQRTVMTRTEVQSEIDRIPDIIPDGPADRGRISVKEGQHERGLIVDNLSDEIITELRVRFPDATVEPRILSLKDIFLALVRNGKPGKVNKDGETVPEFGVFQ